MAIANGIAQLQRELFTIAASEESFEGSHKLIRRIAEESEADGVLLWRLSEQDAHSDTCRLLASDQYFSNDTTPFWHSLSMGSPTGKALRAGKTDPIYIPAERIELTRSEIPEDSDFEVIDRLKIQSFLIVPVFTTDGRAWGALNFYSREAKPVPSANDAGALRDIASLMPVLYDAIDKSTGFDLILEIRKLVGEKERGPLTTNRRRDILSRIAERVENTFGVAEVSVYLEAMDGAYRALRREASQWPWEENKPKERYLPGEGMTGYCFSKSVPVSIPDLAELKNGVPGWVQQKYPEMEPTFRSEFLDALKGRLPKNSQKESPPVSWLGVPLSDGVKTYGVLRICGSLRGPYYFQERHRRLLEIVAAQVGQWYGANIRLIRAEQNKKSLAELVEGLSQLNAKIMERVSLPNATLEEVRRLLFSESMQIVSASVPESETNSIRLVRGNDLCFEYTLGTRWEEGGKAEFEKRLATKFPLTGAGAGTAGSRVVTRNQQVQVSDTEKGEFHSILFSDVRSMLISPVAAGRSVFGTLDLRSGRAGAFEEVDAQITLLVGRQLGLYLRMIEQIFALRRAQAEQEFEKNSLRMTLENVEHQLKTPVFLATRRSVRLAGRAKKQCPSMGQDLEALAGLCRRAAQIVKNVRLFTSLAREETPRLELAPLRSGELLEMLNEFKRDYILLSDPERKLQIEIAESSFSVLDATLVQADPELLAQMLGNLLENAIKYSYRDTTIRVRGATTRNDTCFAIVVANKGVPVSPAQAKTLLRERGQRADQATMHQQAREIHQKAEGSGLGLYLVNEIISAHKGFLEIEPTNPQTGITEFRIAFPKNRSTL